MTGVVSSLTKTFFAPANRQKPKTAVDTTLVEITNVKVPALAIIALVHSPRQDRETKRECACRSVFVF